MSEDRRRRNIYEWHRWFAWRRTPVGWLRYVERRKQWECRPRQRCRGGFRDGPFVGVVRQWWEYRGANR